MTDKGREASMKTRNFTSANACHKLGSPRARRLLVLAIILLPCLALAQVPFIEQVSPPVVAAGATNVTLTVTGANFDSSTSVVMGTTPGSNGPLSTTFVSPEKVTASFNAPNPAESVFIRVLSKSLLSNPIPLAITTQGNIIFGNTSICFGVWSASSNPPCTDPTGPRSDLKR